MLILSLGLLFLLFLGVGFVVSSEVLLDHLLLSYGRFSMYLSVDLGISEKVIIAFHEFTTSFFVETALREGNNQKALDDFEDVGERPAAGIPVLLQGVNANLS